MPNFLNRLKKAQTQVRPGRPNYQAHQEAQQRMGVRILHMLLPEECPPLEGDTPELRGQDRDLIARWNSFRSPSEKREARQDAEQVHRKLFPEQYEKEAAE